MTTQLVIIGAGGFGREVFGIVQALRSTGSDWEVEGFVDDTPSAMNVTRVQMLGSRVTGTVAELALRKQSYAAVIAVGSPPARIRIAEALSGSAVHFPHLTHPHATLGPDVSLSDGVVVAPGARLSTNITVGRHVHIDQNATVGHDSILADCCRLNPQACISGSVEVGSAAVIGANATVLQGVTIGNGAIVGAGACVVRNVPAKSVVKGVPAK